MTCTFLKNYFKIKKLSTSVPIPNCKKEVIPLSSQLSLILLVQVPVLPFKERHRRTSGWEVIFTHTCLPQHETVSKVGMHSRFPLFFVVTTGM